jgi:hypothetical protein
VRSLIAALRTLVLPAGATTGGRIVLDGINGTIDIYDSAGDLMVTLDPNGIRVLTDGDPLAQLNASGLEIQDSAGNPRLNIGTGGLPSYMLLSTGEPEEDNYAKIGVLKTFDNGTLRGGTTEITSPSYGFQEIGIGLRVYDDQTKSPGYVFDTSQYQGSADPYVDLCGFGGAPLTVVARDYWIGISSDGNGTPPTKSLSLPRGCIDLGTSTSDVTLSTTAGTFSDIVSVANVPVVGGRRYRVTYDGGHSFVSGGSGFAVGDNWEFHLQRNEGAGYGELTVPVRKRVRANVAIAARFPIPTLIGYYEPAADDTVSFKMRAAKIGGAATVATALETSAGSFPFSIAVDDIGEA